MGKHKIMSNAWCLSSVAVQEKQKGIQNTTTKKKKKKIM